MLCDLADLVQRMNTQLAVHTHVPGPTPSPIDATVFDSYLQTAFLLGGKLKIVTLI